MPTGYTSGIADGTVTDFAEYALTCARAFGACIMLRDEPMSMEIPEFKPSGHYELELEAAKASLAEMSELPDFALVQMQAAEEAENAKIAKKGIEEIKAKRDRYVAMLEKAKAFKPPTPDHEVYAKFLVSQIQESMDFDLNDTYYQELKQVASHEEWIRERTERLQRRVGYYEAESRREIERTVQRNEWVRNLKESLGLISPAENP